MGAGTVAATVGGGGGEVVAVVDGGAAAVVVVAALVVVVAGAAVVGVLVGGAVVVARDASWVSFDPPQAAASNRISAQRAVRTVATVRRGAYPAVTPVHRRG
jgi:hypothetical protein